MSAYWFFLRVERDSDAVRQPFLMFVVLQLHSNALMFAFPDLCYRCCTFVSFMMLLALLEWC